LKLPRRQFLHLAAGAAALPVLSRIVQAQAYPSQPVRIVVGFAAGGGNDIVARLMGQWLSERLGQSFIIENRPGAGGTIATETVVRAPADGYTLLFVTSTYARNTTLYDKLNFIFHRDIAAVASIMSVPNVVAVTPSLPVKTMPEFMTYARANPGKLNMGSGGIGASEHLFGELFKMMNGVDLVHVPYRGVAPALTDLIGGQVQVVFSTLTAAIQYIRAGNLRALAVTSATRSEALPNVPAVSEFVPGYEASTFYGLGAPMNIPAEIVERLNKEINAALVDPKIKARLADLGGKVLPGAPADFGKLILDETERWAKVIRAANIKLD